MGRVTRSPVAAGAATRERAATHARACAPGAAVGAADSPPDAAAGPARGPSVAVAPGAGVRDPRGAWASAACPSRLHRRPGFVLGRPPAALSLPKRKTSR